MKPQGSINHPPTPGGTTTRPRPRVWLPPQQPPATTVTTASAPGSTTQTAPPRSPFTLYPGSPWHTTHPLPAGTSTITNPPGSTNHPPQPPLPETPDTLFAHFATAGQLSTAITPKHHTTPDYESGGTLSIATTPRITLPANFGGAAQLSLLLETIGGNPELTTTFTGDGALTVDTLPRLDAATADATADATLTTDTLPRLDTGTAALTGAGTLTAATKPRYTVAADFTSTGGLTADAAPAAVSVTPAFASTGTLTVATLPQFARTLDLAGAGTLSVTRGRGWVDFFTRSNSSTLGAGWTQGGSGSGIGVTSNATSWGNGGGTDGDAYAIRDEDILTNDQYLRVVVSTASASRASRLMLQINSGVTAHAYLNWFSTAIYFGRSTDAYPGSITDMGSATSGISIGSGTVIEFYNTGSVYRVDVDGVNKITVDDTGGTIARSASTRRVGFGQARATFANSGFITEWQGRDRIANAA